MQSKGACYEGPGMAWVLFQSASRGQTLLPPNADRRRTGGWCIEQAARCGPPIPVVWEEDVVGGIKKEEWLLIVHIAIICSGLVFKTSTR